MIILNSNIKAQVLPPSKQTTICNPVNLSYRFCLDTPSRREAADPAVINFKNDYFLFASKSGGYWHSADMVQWDFITSADLPLEDYAPAAVVIGDTVYFMASSGKNGSPIYKTADPLSGKWQLANDKFPIAMADPDLFLDDDGRLYLYYGCSNVNPVYAVELNKTTLMPVGEPVHCFNSNREKYGWERSGNYNDKPDAPWIEGSWMTKHNGKYYLQYAAPGTEFKSYADGMYVADKPLGPFKLAVNNPFSAKPEGFIAGAGHSSVFKDRFGNYWQVSTMTVSVKHMFERRIGIFPAFFEPDGNAYAYTKFGDFPLYLPKKKIISPAGLWPGWMLLSYKKPVSVSSTLDGYPAANAADEEIRTYWSAASGNTGEWIMIDLEQQKTVNAVQLNFAEQGTNLYGRTAGIYYRYKLEYSNDKKNWRMLADKSLNNIDAPHDYLQLAAAVKARYIRLTNLYTPGGNFALSGLRVFGKSNGSIPAQVSKIKVKRADSDGCVAVIQWDKIKNATGYVIRYGTAPGKLYQHYQVFEKNAITIRNLDKNRSYYFTVDSFNETGVQEGVKIILVK
ncbi:MAG: family 43 glycosylhydrolase [Ferruginibacter sp.]